MIFVVQDMVGSVAHSILPYTGVQCVAAVMSGCTTSVLLNPMDLVRTRVQVQRKTIPDTIRQIYRVPTLYRITSVHTGFLLYIELPRYILGSYVIQNYLGNLTFYQKQKILYLSYVLQIQKITSKIPISEILFIQQRLDTMSLFFRAKKDFFVLSLNFSHFSVKIFLSLNFWNLILLKIFLITKNFKTMI